MAENFIFDLSRKPSDKWRVQLLVNLKVSSSVIEVRCSNPTLVTLAVALSRVYKSENS